MPPDFLVVGHVSKDVAPLAVGGWRLGGTVSFAAALAARLGHAPAVLTSAASDVSLSQLLPYVEWALVPSDTTTSFENLYTDGMRTQSVRAIASRLTVGDLPDWWKSIPVVLIGPIINEIDITILRGFPKALVGVCLQGWLRRVNADFTVGHVPLGDVLPVLRACQPEVVFLSEEDIAEDVAGRGLLTEWSQSASSPIIVLTLGNNGAEIWQDGEGRTIPPFNVEEVDATGAGDIFASAFLIRYYECGDVSVAATFAAAAAALSVCGSGVECLPDREAIQQLLFDQPEVRLS